MRVCGRWDVGLEGALGGSLAATCVSVCVDVLSRVHMWLHVPQGPRHKSFLTYVCMYTTVCLHVEALKRPVLVALRSGSNRGDLLGKLCWHRGFSPRLCRLAELMGFLWREQTPIWELGPLLQKPCCKSPGYPGSRRPQDSLGVPSRDKAGFEV